MGNQYGRTFVPGAPVAAPSAVYFSGANGCIKGNPSFYTYYAAGAELMPSDLVTLTPGHD